MITKEESFKVEKGLPEGVFAHHVFHVHAPAVVQNLLPVSIMVEAEVCCVSAVCSKIALCCYRMVHWMRFS